MLAALDLAEPDPLWTTVIDRLRLAAAGEGNAGRARAALVYALAKSGDVPGAKAELAKLDALTRPYPLAPAAPRASSTGRRQGLPRRRRRRERAARRPELAADAAAVRRAPGGAERRRRVERARRTASAMQGGRSRPSSKGDWNRARQIYEAIVARNPSDSEALAGLGDVDAGAGRTAGAVSAYQRALAVNPSYLPALLGVADTRVGERRSRERAARLQGHRRPLPRGHLPRRT